MKTDILKGKENNNQYQNISFLTNGGMGDIYLAEDVVNKHKVAIKIIRITDNESKALLNEEFKIALSLSHKNIVTTYFAGEFSDTSGNYFYAVMEYSNEGNLYNKISSATSFFPIKDCLEYFYDLMNGLLEAHKSIIHRDLKPQNILIGFDKRLKLCDFGIAKYVDALTRTKTFKGSGSYPYMSPECWMHDSNTKQMDIYSLGILFFEILTLKKPFIGTTEKEYRDKHVFENLPSLLILRQDVPISIVEIIRKMTNKGLHERYQNINEIIDAFDKVVQIENNRQSNIQSILANSHFKINAIAEEAAKTKKAQEEFIEKQNIINYIIEKVFDNFSSIADAVNGSLSSNQITYRKFIVSSNALASTYKLHFFDYSLTISFYSQDIEQYIRHRRAEIINIQMKKYGTVLQTPQDEFLQTDNIVLVGKVEINRQIGRNKIGFNLLLRKKSVEDIYGQWWVAYFKDNASFSNVSPSEYYYAIDCPEFFNEFEFGRQRVSHTRRMIYKELEEIDITDIISKMPL